MDAFLHSPSKEEERSEDEEQRPMSVFRPDMLDGKVALVTGGGSGICKGMTRALMAHGCDAVIISRSQERLDTTAAELAERIIYEANHYGLDVALFAAIAWSESWYQLSARGTSGERGLWQVYPDADWKRQSRVDQRHWTRHIVLSTWRAATIVAHFAARHGHTAASYCHYNSGYAHCRRSYRAALRTRARAIRRALMMYGRPR